MFGASLNSLLVRGRGVSAYYARRDPLSTNELAGLEALLDTVLSCSFRDVVDSYLFRMHTFHDTSHCIIGPTGSMNKHTYLLTGSCC